MEKHIRNNTKCPACCCGGIYIHKGCGGRWHERVVDDVDDEGFVHNYKCDKCNQEDYISYCQDMPIEFKD